MQDPTATATGRRRSASGSRAARRRPRPPSSRTVTLHPHHCACPNCAAPVGLVPPHRRACAVGRLRSVAGGGRGASRRDLSPPPDDPGAAKTLPGGKGGRGRGAAGTPVKQKSSGVSCAGSLGKNSPFAFLTKRFHALSQGA